jgi:hypothetical protein
VSDDPEREPADADDADREQADAGDSEDGHTGTEVADQSKSGKPAKETPSRLTPAWRRVREEFHTPNPDTYNPSRRFSPYPDELAAELATEDVDVSAAILAEARDYANRSVESRVDSVERRAATLQSATAIAGTFTLAGAVLVVTDVHRHGWQIGIGAVLLFIALNLGMCGWRATQASSHVITWSREPARDILKRPRQTTAQANIDRAAQTLVVADWNGRYARWKVDMLKRAGRHLVRATLGLPLLMAVVLADVIAHPAAGTTSPHPHRTPIVIRGGPGRPGHHALGRPRLQVPRQHPPARQTTTSHQSATSPTRTSSTTRG